MVLMSVCPGLVTPSPAAHNPRTLEEDWSKENQKEGETGFGSKSAFLI